MCALGARHRLVPQRRDLPGAAEPVGGLAALGLPVVRDADPRAGQHPRGVLGHTAGALPALPRADLGPLSAGRAVVRGAVRRHSRLGSATTGRFRRSWSSSPGSCALGHRRRDPAAAEEDRLAVVGARDGAVRHGCGGNGALARPARGGDLRRGLVRRVLPDSISPAPGCSASATSASPRCWASHWAGWACGTSCSDSSPPT